MIYSKVFSRSNLFYLIFIFLFTIICLEIAGRFYLTNILQKSTDPKFRFNSYRIFEHIPHFREGANGRDWIVINGQGFRRTTEVSLKKPPNAFRVFLMGGSVAHGVSSAPPYPLRHIYPEETIDAYLEKQLRANHPDKNIEIINAAVTAYMVNQHTAYIQEVLLNYSPDMIIFFDGANDHFPINSDYDYFDSNRFQFWKPRLQQPSITGMFDYSVLWLSRYSAFARGLHAWRLQKDAGQNVGMIEPIEQAKVSSEMINKHKILSRKQYLRSVEINLNMLNNFGIHSLVVLQPLLRLRNEALRSPIEKSFHLENSAINVLYPHVVEDLKRITAKFKVPFIDMNPAFNNDTLKQEQLFIDFAHLTPLGGQVVADQILPVVDSLCRQYFQIRH